ncbi:MAG TPA: DUF378 domain-containing protein [Chlamydiales bacterium]|nr:DUF378 domain-containing protein [Chlamydiales bacterium]
MKKIDSVATFLVVLGALNWGLIGIFNFDLFDFFLEQSWADRTFYALIGFAGLFKAIYWLTGNWQTRFEHNVK